MTDSSYNARQLGHMREFLRRYRDQEIGLPELMNGLSNLTECLQSPDPQWKTEWDLKRRLLEDYWVTLAGEGREAIDVRTHPYFVELVEELSRLLESS